MALLIPATIVLHIIATDNTYSTPSTPVSTGNRNDSSTVIKEHRSMPTDNRNGSSVVTPEHRSMPTDNRNGSSIVTPEQRLASMVSRLRALSVTTQHRSASALSTIASYYDNIFKVSDIPSNPVDIRSLATTVYSRGFIIAAGVHGRCLRWQQESMADIYAGSRSLEGYDRVKIYQHPASHTQYLKMVESLHLQCWGLGAYNMMTQNHTLLHQIASKFESPGDLQSVYRHSPVQLER